MIRFFTAPASLLAQSLTLALAMTLAFFSTPASAQAQRGKLLLTGGVSTIEGSAGGGLTPWALTGTYATQGEFGGTAFVTGAKTQDYALTTLGAAAAYSDRIEVSFARQNFDAKDNLAALGLKGLKLKQDVVGLKWRVVGDAVLDSDTWMPQIALGIQYKKADAAALAPVLFGPLGAKDSGTDFYVSGTKLFLAQGVLANLTLRATKANQGGLLGFGGAESNKYKVQPEISIAKLLRKDLAVGFEYRAKPDNLYKSVLGNGALKEDDWYDVFIAWAPSKQVSVTLAYVNLGRIAPAVQPRRQTGTYLSVQAAY